MSKAKSGLASVKRDFSSSSVGSQDAIPWDPTPPKATSSSQTTSSTPELSARETARERRLREIQNALNNRSTPTLAEPTKPSLPSKRPSDPGLSDALQPTKKPRKLPPGYEDDGEHDLSSRSTAFSRNKATYTPAPLTKRKAGTIELSGEQKQILKLVVDDGESVFYTGSAGTGKSVLLREIIKGLKKKYGRVQDAVAMTASTGIAACNIGGVTIHSFAGIGLGIEDAEKLFEKIRRNKKALSRWTRTKVLIIDEVSMLDGDLFDKLSRIGALIRRNMEPFGGIQLVVTGDFFQLPPVGKSGVKFAFEAAMWKQAIPRTFNLTQVFRQSDQEFIDMLNEMRFGQLTQKSIDKFRSLSREIVYEDGLGPTELFPRREDVHQSNNSRMTRLNTEVRNFKSSDGGSVTDPTARGRLLSNFMAEENLQLREGAQVMLIKNMDEQLVNGSMGIVLRFADPAKALEEDFDILGETTVAVPGGKKPASSAVGKTTASRGILYPIVEFSLATGAKATMMVKPESFKVELPTGEVQASRSQLPLILAWALSIHKSQGQTLERVKVDLGRVFEKGQAYVALSRATSLQGLQILNFDPSKVMAHHKVTEWSKTLQQAVLDEW
ncbi:ATP-dependent DNA helicase PIF1 [Mycena indigotica]|uniref:ATP-dependent DNA helicase PIF1 n=1 Tax=Mycena indigotica TaxID=2126181 RepID=A0A8H6WB99_9AGAR|nr:ATP-dependent DNA helicase PIF1 [Mycena indigotica]KAF7310006.1 ATP-dependent DNA helicase PIF1 [Mycena indigotica]